MKYFLDTEFIEGFKKPISWLPTIGNFNKEYHSIQLISIGIVCEDGREYYAISKEFNPDDASKWVEDNVISPIEIECYKKTTAAERQKYIYGKGKKALHYCLNRFGKSNKQIAEEIKKFTGHIDSLEYTGYESEFNGHSFITTTQSFFLPDDLVKKTKDIKEYIKSNFTLEHPEFYAYYADYDWVVFCSLFGTMMDLPEGFPMYCKDLKQFMDTMVDNIRAYTATGEIDFYASSTGMVYKENSTKENLQKLKKHKDYPRQENKHNALEDAKWNHKLYKFLKSI